MREPVGPSLRTGSSEGLGIALGKAIGLVLARYPMGIALDRRHAQNVFDVRRELGLGEGNEFLGRQYPISECASGVDRR